MSCTVCRGYAGVACPVCGPQPGECPDCHGQGHDGYHAFNVITRRDVEVTETTWLLLPEDEDDAERMGQHYCRMDMEPCRRCGGSGTI